MWLNGTQESLWQTSFPLCLFITLWRRTMAFSTGRKSQLKPCSSTIYAPSMHSQSVQSNLVHLGLRHDIQNIKSSVHQPHTSHRRRGLYHWQIWFPLKDEGSLYCQLLISFLYSLPLTTLLGLQLRMRKIILDVVWTHNLFLLLDCGRTM